MILRVSLTRLWTTWTFFPTNRGVGGRRWVRRKNDNLHEVAKFRSKRPIKSFKRWSGKLKWHPENTGRRREELPRKGKEIKILTFSRGDMLSKVRQFREDAAKHSADLRKWHEKERQELISVASTNTAATGGQDLSQDERHRRQILEGTSILERTSQSIIRYA